MQTLFLTTPLRRMALAFSLLLPAVSAHAALPSVEVRVDFTGSQAGGGNGAQPNGALSALDGYLYGSTVFGGGTEADLDGTNGNYGGRVPVFFRIREDGDGYEVLQRAPELLPASDYGWLAGSDGHLYAPSNTSLGLLLRYLPGSDGWTAFGPEAATSPRTDERQSVSASSLPTMSRRRAVTSAFSRGCRSPSSAVGNDNFRSSTTRAPARPKDLRVSSCAQTPP